MSDHAQRLDAIARWLQQEDEELLYTPDADHPPATRAPASGIDLGLSGDATVVSLWIDGVLMPVATVLGDGLLINPFLTVTEAEVVRRTLAR